MNGEYYNIDCMELMGKYPDKHFDLAIVDPEYGVKQGNKTHHGARKNSKLYTKYIKKNWDNDIPNEIYFQELFRVSFNQIIFGGNYFTNFLKPTKSWIFWDKGFSENFSFAAGEMAWTSFDIQLKKVCIFVEKNCISNNAELAQKYSRIHPTQKPVKLYEWLLQNYAKPNDVILDTHVGSASSLIACENMGFKYVGCELDKDYYEASMKRLTNHLKQGKLF